MSNSKEHTCNKLKRLIKNENLCALSVDKDFCFIIMNKKDYIQKVNTMLDKDIIRGTYDQWVNMTK